jgi:hypothetical protein
MPRGESSSEPDADRPLVVGEASGLAVTTVLVGDQALVDVNFRGVDGVLLYDFAFIEKNYERLLVTFGTAIDQIHVGNEVCGFRVQSREFIFPRLIAAVSKAALDWIPVQFAHMRLRSSSFDQLSGHGFR